MDDSSGYAEEIGSANGDGVASCLAAQAVRFAVAGHSILNGIDLTVAPGEKLAVIGPKRQRQVDVTALSLCLAPSDRRSNFARRH